MPSDSLPAWRNARALAFPPLSSLGEVYLLDVVRSKSGAPEARWGPWSWRREGEARGPVQVPAGSLACLQVAPGRARAFARLVERGFSGLDGVHASFTELGDDELAVMAQLPDLY